MIYSSPPLTYIPNSLPNSFPHDSDEDLLLLVEDTGMGIPVDKKATVFSPFQVI